MSHRLSIDPARLQSAIEKTGLSKKDICSALDIPFVTLRRWVKGEVKQLREENIRKLSSILGCQPNELVERGDNELVLTSSEFSNIMDDLEENNYFNSMLASCWRSGLMVFKALVRPELKGTQNVISIIGSQYSILSITKSKKLKTP